MNHTIKLAALFLLTTISTWAVGGSCNSIPVPSGITSCFYVSKSAGSDSNAGTSEASPWAHLPGMPSCTGTCASTTPAPGYGFILKGGDTWVASDLGVSWNWAGTAANPIYIGVDPLWFTGGSWTRPIWTCGGVNCGGSTLNFFLIGNSAINYVILDNLEMKGLYFNLSSPVTFIVVYSDHIEAEHMYFHGWSHANGANNSGFEPGAFACQTNGGGSCIGTKFHDSVLDGSDTTKDMFFAQYGGSVTEIYNNYYSYMAGALVGSANLVHDNLVENTITSFDGNHANALFNFGASSGNNVFMYNNVVRHTTGCVGCVNYWINGLSGAVPSFVGYFFNNVGYDLNPSNIINIGNHPAANYGTYYVFNNTVECGTDSSTAPCIGGADSGKTFTVYTQNDHWITSSSGCSLGAGQGTCATPVTVLTQSVAVANGQGYTSSSTYAFQPTSGSGGTINTGTNSQSLCTTITTINSIAGAACQFSTGYACTYVTSNHTMSCPSLPRNARPVSASWNIGAYQYTVSGPVDTVVPSSIAFGTQTVGSQSTSQTVQLTNTGTTPDTISSIVLTGTNGNNFLLTPASTCPSVLAPSISCNIYIAFAPLVQGALSANVHIVDTANSSGADVVSLSGTGFPPGAISLANSPTYASCAANTSLCSIAIPSTPASGALVPFATGLSAGNFLLGVTDGGDAFSSCTALGGSNCHNTGTFPAVDFMVSLSSTGGKTQLTCNLNTSNAFVWICGIYELITTSPGGFAFDASGSQANSTPGGTQPGPALILSGTNDVILHITSVRGENVSSINGSYTLNIDPNGNGEAHLLNTISGSAPLWTFNGPNGTSGAAALALRSPPPAQPAPSISSLSVTSGTIGTAGVQVNGLNFGVSQDGSTLTINGSCSLTVTGWTSSQITFTVPACATTGGVVVSTSSGVSNSISFTILPNLTGMSPSVAQSGAQVTLTGTGLGLTQGPSTINIPGGGTPTVNSWSSTSITFTLPCSAITGNVSVTVGGNTSGTESLTAVPYIITISPTSGSPLTAVTITGCAFGATQGTKNVYFNSTLASCTSWSNLTLQCASPSSGTTGSVIVTDGDNPSNGVTYTYAGVALPVISSVTPNVAMVGTVITVTGSAFGNSQGGSNIKFSGITASVTSWSNVSIVCTVPAGTVSGSIIVTTGVGSSNPVTFTLISVPVIIIQGMKVNGVTIQ